MDRVRAQGRQASAGVTVQSRGLVRLLAVYGIAAIAGAACSWGQDQAQRSPASPSPIKAAGGQTASPSPSPTPIASPSPSPQIVVSLNVAFGSIYYGLPGKAHCPNTLLHIDNVVLVQDKLQYTGDEIARMAGAKAATSGDGSQLDPSLLVLKPGVATGVAPTAYTDFGGAFTGPSCVFVIEVTNTGSGTVQIARAGLRLTQAAVPNNDTYRMVEVCSVIKATHDCPPPIGHGGLPCSVYGVAVGLQDGPAGAEFFGTPAMRDFNTGQPCPAPVLPPQQSVDFVVAVYSATELVYRAAPSLDVITSTAHGTVAFPQLESSFVFADISRFSCYKLIDTTFQLLWQGSAAQPGPTSGWCE